MDDEMCEWLDKMALVNKIWVTTYGVYEGEELT